MKNNSKEVVKAYENLEFLKSTDARIIRILSEFLEPTYRFKKFNIKDTIVFFGSSRIKPPKKTKAKYNEILKKIKKSNNPSKQLLKDLEIAKVEFEMSKYYEDAIKLSYMLTRWSKSLNDFQHFVICSGGGPGIMEAANLGAKKAGGKSIGFNISIPAEQYPNKYITKELGFEFHYFFIRKFWFAYLGKALVIFPGGFGTMDELFEILTLIQTKKIKKKMTIVIYGRDYWNQVVNFEAMVRMRTVDAPDLNLLKFVDTPEEAFEYLKDELTRNYLNIGGIKDD
jgi:uncharacterized protein (TIGR00730 family)